MKADFIISTQEISIAIETFDFLITKLNEKGHEWTSEEQIRCSIAAVTLGKAHLAYIEKDLNSIKQLVEAGYITQERANSFIKEITPLKGDCPPDITE